jgi:hypothetical protein
MVNFHLSLPKYLNTMAKSLNAQKSEKKAPAKTAKEKKEEKREKKASKK